MDALPVDQHVTEPVAEVRLVSQFFVAVPHDEEVDTSRAVEGMPNGSIALEYVLPTENLKRRHYAGVELSQQIESRFVATAPDTLSPEDHSNYEYQLKPELSLLYGFEYRYLTGHAPLLGQYQVSGQIASGLVIDTPLSDPQVGIYLNLIPANLTFITDSNWTYGLAVDLAAATHINHGLLRASLGKRL